MPINRQFKELLNGEQVEYVECRFYRRNRNVAEFVTETGVHGINLLEYLFGEIAEVYTDRWTVPNSSTFNWLADIRFSTGIRGLIKFFPMVGVNMEMVEINGRDLTASVVAAHPLTDARQGFIKVQRHSGAGELGQSVVEQPEVDPLCAGGFEGEYQDFFRAIRENRETVSNFQNAWRTEVIAEAIQNGDGVKI
jgi:predicted dehydrogenase